MKKRLLAAFSSVPLIIVLLSYAQTSQDPCPPGVPKCFRDLVPYAGHNLSASQLPPNLCPEGCAGDNRRVIVIRVDSSWGSPTNSTILDAVHCAAAAWNNATDGASPPNKTGYYFAVDPFNFTEVTNADITITREKPPDGIAACDVGHDADNANRQNTIKLDPVNGDLGNSSGLHMTANDLCGRVAHELGHLIGLAEVPDCRSIMFGANLNGSRDVNNVQPNDVAQVNKNFNSATRDTCQATTTKTGAGSESIISPTPTPTPTDGCPDDDHDGVCNDSDCNDNAFWASFDRDSDGFCEDVDCNDVDPRIYPGAPIDTEPIPGEDWNCNGQDDYRERFCGIDAELSCRAAGRDWEASHCQCNFFSDPSPVLVDVAGDGFRLSSSNNGVRFDLNNDGVKEQLSWTARFSDDAWLVLDRNGNGVIDNGAELFGNFTPQPSPSPGEERNGFLALAQYDKTSNGGNEDGLISDADAVFNFLLLWQDANHNGISEVAELFPLAQLNVETIDLEYKVSRRTDDFGNQFRYRTKIKDRHGNTGRWAWDVFLVSSP